jgi:transposase
MSSGPPSKLVQAQPAILLGLRRGLSLEDAAQSAGITYRTLRNWVRRGEVERDRLEEDSGAAPNKNEAPYLQFLEGYEEAKADGQLLLANVVKTAADGGHKIRETRITEVVVDGTVARKETQTIEREVGPDWKAAAFILERRYGWGRHDRQDHVDIDLEDFTAEELQRVINGEDPLQVISERTAQVSGESDAAAQAEASYEPA